MIDELKQWEYDKGYDKGKAEMLKVIEDIKVEIDNAILNEDCNDISFKNIAAFNDGLLKALKIIDRHCGGDKE